MRKNLKLLLIAMLILGLMLVGTACGNEATSDNDESAKEKLIVGSQTTYPPFEFVENGEYVGFDMDLIRALGEVMGYEIEIKSLGFDALIPAVNGGQIDLAISAKSITEERKKAVDFTQAYFNAGLIIAVQVNDDSISGLEDLSGKVLAAEVGTIGADTSLAIKEENPATTVKIFDTVGEAFMELKQGRADAVINDHPVTDYYVKTTGDGKIKMVGEIFSADDQYGIIVKKGNQELLDKLNDAIDQVKADGTYDEIYQKWFGN